MIGQGVVLMLAGMGIVYVFLTLLIYVTKFSCAGVSKFDSILPQDAPKKAPQKKVSANEDENIALAIAVAMNG